VALEEGRAFIVDVERYGADVVHTHDATLPDPSTAFALSRLSHGPHGPTPIGVFRDVVRPVYEDALEAQIAAATEAKGAGDLASILGSNGTWTVG
jgi:2-oxoglutarate ferredoxin oxidoreductase subunit beta